MAETDAHSDDLLHSPSMDRLSQEDRNLTTALVMGVLRWQIALDAQVAKLLIRPGQQLAEPVAIALRLGAFQLQHMDRIPAHAAINESVELSRAAGQAHAAGMVNAILRKLTTQTRAMPVRGSNAAKHAMPIFESPAACAQRLGHPAWLVERWIAKYGRESALAICEYDQHEHEAGSLFAQAGAVNADKASLLSAPAQVDDGSRLVAELAAAALPDRVNRTPRVWDCCAAPGGKTLLIADRLPTAQILATDISPRRLARMKERIAASPFADRIECEVLDAAQPDPSGNMQFNMVLCDVPCSGTGTLARNPEIRHRLRPEGLPRQAERQKAILSTALARLAPGGRLLYSTCSLEPEENEQVIEAVVTTERVHRISVEPLLEQLERIHVLRDRAAPDLASTATRHGYLRTIPGIHSCDGFFAALLERN